VFGLCFDLSGINMSTQRKDSPVQGFRMALRARNAHEQNYERRSLHEQERVSEPELGHL